MGKHFSKFADKDFKLYITTGDKKGAGTNTNVWIRLVDKSGAITPPILLDNVLHNELVGGQTDTYEIAADGLKNPESIHHIVVLRDDTGIGTDWFLDKIEVEDILRHTRYLFPVHRWIKLHEAYELFEFDDFVPSKDPNASKRNNELTQKRQLYQYIQRVDNGPKQVKLLPDDEKFTEAYKSDIEKSRRKLQIGQFFIRFTTLRWNSFKHVESLFDGQCVFLRPASIDCWTEDKWFGRQRLEGVNPTLIRLCKAIPAKLDVSADLLEFFLEGYTLNEALNDNKIFIIDLEILDGVFTKKASQMVAPIALFFLNKKDDLMPICIQLFQQPGKDNPVYYPNDPKYTWIMAKMFYNMGEAQHHQAIAHLGFTHILMEGLCVCTHRHLSPSHPIFRLLAPHFLYLLATNTFALERLVSPGGWVDQAFSCAVTGLDQLIVKGYNEWRLTINGDMVNEFSSRGVSDPKILPNYHYRDDAISIYKVIEKYVTNIVFCYYDSDDSVKTDWELQSWVNEMKMPSEEGGLGLKGIPQGMNSLTDLIRMCTFIITTCSVQHAAVNYQQYDQYAFLPNYPSLLLGLPPKEKREMNEEDLVKFIPDLSTMLNLLVVTKILSKKKNKQSLGDFEVQYLYAPDTMLIAQEFRDDLKQLHDLIAARNKTCRYKYEWLDPLTVPNAICI